MHAIAAKAVAFQEALTPEYKECQFQTVRNAIAMAERLLESGFELVSGGTDNHLLLVKLIKKGITGKEADETLERAGITLNKNMIPFDPATPFVTSGIRIGTPAMTTQGMKEPEMIKMFRYDHCRPARYQEREDHRTSAPPGRGAVPAFPLYPDLA